MERNDEFRLTEAALAIGTTPKQIRNWLAREQIFLDADRSREPGSWRSLTFLDVLRIALVKELAGFCVPVKRASEIVEGAMRVTFGRPSVFEGYDAVLDIFGSTTLYVWPDDGKWDWGTRPPSVRGQSYTFRSDRSWEYLPRT